MQGMIVDVYRTRAHPQTTNGPTRCEDRVLLIGKGVPPLYDTQKEEGPVFVTVLQLFKKQDLRHRGEDYLYAAPILAQQGNRCFGGNFIYSSDARFPSKYPIPVHDQYVPNDYGPD